MCFNADDKCVRQLQSVPATEWVEKMVNDYHDSGIVDLDGLVRLLGAPTGSVSLADPAAILRRTLTTAKDATTRRAR